MQFTGKETLLPRETTKIQRKGDLVTQRNSICSLRKGDLIAQRNNKKCSSKERELFSTNVYFSFWSENWNKVGTNIDTRILLMYRLH
jgi:hypothetical protein